MGLLGVLVEPASIVAKAWEQIEKIGRRTLFQPHKVLITGAGPIGLLAFLMARQREFETQIIDRAIRGPKPELVEALGGHFHSSFEDVSSQLGTFDLALECTGVAELIVVSIKAIAPDGIVCLTGVSRFGKTLAVDVGRLNREIVLENEIIFGSVNANRRHYELAVKALLSADANWLNKIISRKVSLDN